MSPEASPDRQLRRNLALYSVHTPLAAAFFWAPVFFLYLSERFPVEQVLRLHALYYLTVVVLEVPSGYLSDRLGRVLTLRISDALGVACFVLFLWGGSSLLAFAAAQIALAGHFAFRSGTDVSFHFDSLAGLDRAGEFGGREARVQRNSYLAGSLGALVGGGAAVFDLSWAYVLSLVAASVLLAITLLMREPPHLAVERTQETFFGQIGACVRETRNPLLGWIFGYVVLQMVVAHVPYEFTQPYVALVFGETAQEAARTPLATGLIAAVIALLGALAAARSMRWVERVGTARTLLALTALQTGVIALMALVVHWAVVPFLALRSVQPGAGKVIVAAQVTPRLRGQIRATYLSLQSLAGRLAYAGVLLSLSTLAGAGAEPSAETLGLLLRSALGLALAGLVLLAILRPASLRP